MKKIIKSIFLIIFATVTISLFSKVEAASATISANKTTATVGDSVKVTVTVNAAAWNINVSGSASDSIVGFNSDAENQTTTKTYSINTSKAGKYSVSISGDITDASATTPDKINKVVTVTVKAKSTSSSTNNNSNSNSTSNSGSTKKEPKFTSVNQTMYTTGEVNIRKSYSTSSAIIKTVAKGTKVTRTGIATTKTSDGITWSKVTYNGQTAYISSSLLTKTKPAEDKPKTEEPKSNTATNQTTNNETINNENTNNTTEPVNNEVDNSNTDNTNAALGLSKLEIAGVNFSEGFDPSIHSYTLKLNFFVKDLNITAEANKTDAKVEIIGNENFEAGENNVTILVSSADNKETATYQIKVTIPSEVASSPQNNIQFYLMCGTIILAAIVVIGIIISIYKKKNKTEVDYKESKTNNDMIDPYTDIKPKKEKVKSGKHSN